jgi:hypothetical protein
MVLHDPVVRTIQGCDLKCLVQFSSTLLTETDQNQTVTQALQNKVSIYYSRSYID